MTSKRRFTTVASISPFARAALYAWIVGCSSTNDAHPLKDAGPEASEVPDAPIVDAASPEAGRTIKLTWRVAVSPLLTTAGLEDGGSAAAVDAASDGSSDAGSDVTTGSERRRAHRREQRGEFGGFVVDHVVDTMRRRRGIEQASDGLRDVGVVADRHALGRREAAHHRDDLGDVRITVAVDERQPEHAHVETFHRKEEALGGELACGVPVHRRARVVLAGRAAAIGTVNQPGAGEDEALHGGSPDGACEVLRAEVIDCVRLLGSRAAEERRAVDNGIDAAHRRCERIHSEQIALGELDAIFAQVGGARLIAHQGAHLVAAPGKSFGESASDLSGRSGDEDLHVRNVALGTRRGLEEADKRASRLARPPRARP